MNSFVALAFQDLLVQFAPIAIVLAVGVWLALKNKELLPRISRLVLIACSVFLFGSIFWHFMFLSFQYCVSLERVSAGDMTWMLHVGTFVSLPSHVVGLSMLLYAVFAGREGAGKPAPALSAEERLASLSGQLARGLISENGYNELRQRVLDSL